MASESGGGQLNRLNAELDQLSGRQATGLPWFAESLSGVADNIRERVEPAIRPVQERVNLATIGGLGLAGVSAVGWMMSRRRRRNRQKERLARAIKPDEAASAQNRFAEAVRYKGPARINPAERTPTTATPPDEITDVTRNFMLGAVMPVWMAAGVADWICHRRAHIEDNAGSRESVMHLLMLAEASLPVIAGMVLEITSPVLLMMFGAIALHSATALWDVSYAVKRRTVTPVEQHVHSYLEMVPVMATSFVAVLHWPELRALLGMGDRKPDWSLRRKARPLPIWAVTALLTGTAVFELLPYWEELQRTRRGGN